ncbi:MAG: hypothetical protein AABZ28_07695 [Nitrospinota bacterium]
MIYKNSHFTRPSILDSNDFNVFDIDNTATSKEASVIHDEFIRSAKHYLSPISTQWANPAIRFFTLKTQWETETAILSSATEIAMHPAYQQIIGMGNVAVPLILSEMKKKPGHWFWALKSITGEDPVSPERRGKIKKMTEVWLNWGKKQGYLV